MQATYRPHNPVILYFPFYRRLLIRTAVLWLVLRAFLEAWAWTATGRPLLPLPAAGIIGFVLALDLVNARAMRETVFRQNAGVGTRDVLAVAGGSLLLLELLARTLLLPHLESFLERLA